MKIERNLRTPENAQHGRYVRVVGDGTAEGTRVLQMNGEPVPERIVGLRLSLDPHECAQGIFWHTVPSEAGDLTEMFVAWVVFEPPPAPSAPEPARYIETVPAPGADTRRVDLLERTQAATHCNFTHPGDWTVTVEGFTLGAERDLEFHGDSLREAIDNLEDNLAGEARAARELEEAEALESPDTEDAGDGQRRLRRPFVVDTGLGAREEPEARLGTPPEARLTIPGPPLAELLAAKREAE